MSANDERILVLKKKIEDKKEELAKQNDRFVPVTNCILEFRDKSYNLNTLTQCKCIDFMVELKALQMAQEALKIEDYTISGYSIECWLRDLKSRVDIIELKAERMKLKAMEAQLDNLLTEDKKTELEIDKIVASLGL